MMPIFLLVPVLNCALLFWDDSCSLEKTIGSSHSLLDREISTLKEPPRCVHKGIAPPVRDTVLMGIV